MPLPRKLNRALLRTPGRLRDSVLAAGAVLDRVRAEVVVGLGGYVAGPAYHATRMQGLPIVAPGRPVGRTPLGSTLPRTTGWRPG